MENIFTWNVRKVMIINSILITYHGSNSWIMLSKRITAKSLDAKPASQASVSTVTVMRVLKPAVLLNMPLLRPSLGIAAVVAGILVSDSPNCSHKLYFIHQNPTIQFLGERKELTFLIWFGFDAGPTDGHVSLKIVIASKKITEKYKAN